VNIQLFASRLNDCCFYLTCFPVPICTPISCRRHNVESWPNEVQRQGLHVYDFVSPLCTIKIRDMYCAKCLRCHQTACISNLCPTSLRGVSFVFQWLWYWSFLFLYVNIGLVVVSPQILQKYDKQHPHWFNWGGHHTHGPFLGDDSVKWSWLHVVQPAFQSGGWLWFGGEKTSAGR